LALYIELEIKDTTGLALYIELEIKDTTGLALYTELEIKDTTGLTLYIELEIDGCRCRPQNVGSDDLILATRNLWISSFRVSSNLLSRSRTTSSGISYLLRDI
jgi:hypothetical protein